MRKNPEAASTAGQVSVLTPSLNLNAYLDSCLESVAHQTYPRIEHIVIDGGSSDGSVERLEFWSKASNRHLLVGKDSGMYEALNRGLEIASGDWFAYLNCDDGYFPYSIEQLVETAEDEAADIVFGDLVRCYEDGRVVVKLHPPFDAGFYGFYFQIAQPTTLIRRSLLDEIGPFDPRYRFAGDSEFFLRAAQAGARFVHIQEIVAWELHRAASSSATFRAAHRAELCTARETHGTSRSTLERFAVGPCRVLRALASQSVRAAIFGRMMTNGRANQWRRFADGQFLSEVNRRSLLSNVLPSPLLTRKASVGTLSLPIRLESQASQKAAS